MELGLSLGDPPKTCGFLSKLNNNTATPSAAAAVAAATSSSLGFCMALGINQEQEKSAQEDDINQDDDDDDDEISEDVREPPVQLDLLPLVPVRSDNGSSEGGSSGNAPAVRGFDVNRMPALPGAEEATSSFRMEFGMYKAGNVSGNKRSNMEPTGNDVAVEAERASSRASDEDENALSRKKLRLSKEQSAYLEESFKEHNTLNPKQKLALAKQLNLRPRQVEVWFQNRRARTKLKQTEVDCEYLKRCCETLTEENRRLHKELQELRALKNTSNPFYMQLPATTLTMCPSCERVATATTTAAAATNSAAAAAAAPSSTTTTTTNNNNPSPISSSKPRFYPFSKATSPQPSTTHSHPPTPS